MAVTIENRITIKFQKFLCRNYCLYKKASFHRELVDVDFGTGVNSRPDGVLICCSLKENKSLRELHSIEAKSIRLINECKFIGKKLPKAFVQARNYYGNYNWLTQVSHLQKYYKYWYLQVKRQNKKRV